MLQVLAILACPSPVAMTTLTLVSPCTLASPSTPFEEVELHFFEGSGLAKASGVGSATVIPTTSTTRTITAKGRWMARTDTSQG
ncbi:hypothetical protein E2C01_079050 [Portunus trituberculatus]|uniref:Secreted protein n=1 Tax=Portunus trituberculatus TaxID=210409 RepID=A0A5B7IKF6_PORTR|nr:hypothetical protein [Portunus trituberculatus]